MIAMTFAASGAMPMADTWCPRKVKVGCPNSHFEGDVEGKAALLHDLKHLPEMLEIGSAVGAAHQVVGGKWEA